MSPSCADSQGDRSLRERILRPLGLFHPRWEPRSGVFFLKDTLMTPELFIVTAILGIVEGLTEFLPISSTGHLIVADQVLHFQSLLARPESAEVFEVVIVWWNRNPKMAAGRKAMAKFSPSLPCAPRTEKLPRS